MTDGSDNLMANANDAAASTPQELLLTVAICTLNRADDLSRAIQSVLEQGLDPARHELLIVDNASTDGTPALVERLSERRAGIRLVREETVGLSRARNRAWREARGQYVVYLDDDAKAPDGWLAAIERIVAEQAPIAFGGPFYPFYLTPRPCWYQDAFGSRELGKQARWLEPGEDLNGGNMAWRRDALERLGGFNPALGMAGGRMAYGEETALFQALSEQESDRAIYYDPAMAILHLVRAEKMTWRWRLRELRARGRDHWLKRLGLDEPPGLAKMLWETVKAALMLAANLSVRFLVYHRSLYPNPLAYLFYRGLEPVGIVGYWDAWLQARSKKSSFCFDAARRHQVGEKLKLSVAYVSFCGDGGMLHYIEEFSKSASLFANSTAFIQDLTGVYEKNENGAKHYILSSKISRVSVLNSLLVYYNPFFYRRMAKCVAPSNRQIDVVHVTSKSVGLLEFTLTLKKRGVKVVYTLHDPTPHETNIPSFRRRIARYLFDSDRHNRIALNQFDRIHVHSETHKREVIRKYGASFESKTYVVPLGGGLTDAIKQGTIIPEELGAWKSDALTALFFGRIEPYKGLDVLCKALQVLKNNGIIINLIIAGSGAFDNSLLDGIADQCRVINRFIEDGEIKSIFSACDACVLPYVDGTQSAVIPLAYNFSKPVIATNVGALSELVVSDVTGLLVEPRDVASLAKALIKINDKETCLRLGLNARHHAQDMSWDKMAGMHVAEYLKLLDQDA